MRRTGAGGSGRNSGCTGARGEVYVNSMWLPYLSAHALPPHTTCMCTCMLASSRHSMSLLPMSALQHLHHVHRLRSLEAHPAPALRACACVQVAERVQCSAIIEAGNSAITPDADVVLQRRGIPVLPVRGQWGGDGKAAIQLMLARAQCVRLGCIWVAGKTAQGRAIVANKPFPRPCPPFHTCPCGLPCTPAGPPFPLPSSPCPHLPLAPRPAPLQAKCSPSHPCSSHTYPLRPALHPAGPVCQRRRLCRLFLRMDAKYQQHAVGGGGGRPEAGHVSACAYPGASCTCCLVVTMRRQCCRNLCSSWLLAPGWCTGGKARKDCTPLDVGMGWEPVP